MWRASTAAVAAAALACGGCLGGGDDGERSTATATPSPREVRADESGVIPVLEYHRVGGDPDFAPELTISAARLRSELERLRREGYFPINFRDLIANRVDVPAGRSPVVLTFDDSSDSQFTVVRRGGKAVADPDGAVGVLTDFHARHGDWPLRATWFVLPAADPPNDLFSQPRLAGAKLRFLVAAGMEIGSHTLWHANLATASPELVQEQLARSLIEIAKHLPDYRVTTLAVPYGEFPQDMDLLRAGDWQGTHYTLAGAAAATGGPAAPQGTRGFDPYRIPRVQTGTAPGQSREVLGALRRGGRYVSDGEPGIVTVPQAHAARMDRAALAAAGVSLRTY